MGCAASTSVPPKDPQQFFHTNGSHKTTKELNAADFFSRKDWHVGFKEWWDHAGEIERERAQESIGAVICGDPGQESTMKRRRSGGLRQPIRRNRSSSLSNRLEKLLEVKLASTLRINHIRSPLSVAQVMQVHERRMCNEDIRSSHRVSVGKGANEISEGMIFRLPRGGMHVNTPAGAVQFGMPPETIKDSLNLGLSVPRIFVVPLERFNLQSGLSVCELEFPAFFNFFVLKRKVTLVTYQEFQNDLFTVMKEALDGPDESQLFTAEDYSDYCAPEIRAAMPNLWKEMQFFREPRPPEFKSIVVDSMIEFVCFDDCDVANLGSGVTVQRRSQGFAIIHRDASDKDSARAAGQRLIAEVKDEDAQSCFAPREHLTSQQELLSRAGNHEGEFVIPRFGVTVLGNSHGFDPDGITSGFVLWVNGQGIMVDPPPHSGAILLSAGIQPKSITATILTHCHADHDAGVFQKIITENKVTIITTRTVCASFFRKYAAVSGLPRTLLEALCEIRHVSVEEPVFWNGASFRFFYSLHAIPCVGFEATFEGKRVAYSADTYYDPEGLHKMQEQGILSPARCARLLSFPWDADVVLHEAGVPPIHTPLTALAALPERFRRNIHLIHIGGKAAEDAARQGFRVSRPGVTNTIVLRSAYRLSHHHLLGSPAFDTSRRSQFCSIAQTAFRKLSSDDMRGSNMSSLLQCAVSSGNNTSDDSATSRERNVNHSRRLSFTERVEATLPKDGSAPAGNPNGVIEGHPRADAAFLAKKIEVRKAPLPIPNGSTAPVAPSPARPPSTEPDSCNSSVHNDQKLRRFSSNLHSLVSAGSFLSTNSLALNSAGAHAGTRSRSSSVGSVETVAETVGETVMSSNSVVHGGRGGATLLRALQLMASCDLFKDFSISQTLELLLSSVFSTYEAGEVIGARGSSGDRFMIIQEGIVEVKFLGEKVPSSLRRSSRTYLHEANNEDEKSNFDLEVISKKFYAGDYLGEVTVLTGAPRTADMVALTPVVTIDVLRYEFKHLMEIAPRFASHMKNLVKVRSGMCFNALAANSVLKALSSSQQTQLQTMLTERRIAAGEVIWSRGDMIESSVLVSEGTFLIKEVHDVDPEYLSEKLRKSRRKSDVVLLGAQQAVLALRKARSERTRSGSESLAYAPLGRGMFFCDILGMRDEALSSHFCSLQCSSPNGGVIYELTKADSLLFLDANPGLLLALLKSALVL